MSSGCRSSLSFVDARVPTRATYVSLYKWPESDAEFAKSVASRQRGSAVDGSTKWSAAAAAAASAMEVDGYSCRQVYLRSYTFSRKESVPERTLRRLKRRMAGLPAWLRRRRRSGVDGNDGGDKTKRKWKKKKKKTKKKKMMREVVCSAICLVFHRFLFCAARVDVLRRE